MASVTQRNGQQYWFIAADAYTNRPEGAVLYVDELEYLAEVQRRKDIALEGPNALVEPDIEEKMAAVLSADMDDRDCPVCMKRLKSKRGRNTHMRMVHNGE